MPIDKSLISGSTTMLLLKLLTEKDMYGYEMIENLRKKSNDVFELKAGTLYPLLHSLEQKGYLTSYEEDASGKVRKYYSITGEGKRYLKGKEEEWKQYAGAVSGVLALHCINLCAIVPAIYARSTPAKLDVQHHRRGKALPEREGRGVEAICRSSIRITGRCRLWN